jgi:hypothetical protein
MLTSIYCCNTESNSISNNINKHRYGQPPVEIIKELAPELQFDDDGMPIMDPMGGNNGMMPPFMPGMPFPGGAGEQCCIC